MELQRRLGIPGATAIGVASMLGAGVFVVWAPATAAAGAAVLLALPLAAVIAALNATSTTRLAMRHPVSGGAYAYGRAELGPNAGFVAGVLFLLGKTASVAAIALVGGGYLWHGYERPIAVALVVVLAAVNATGVRSTAIVSAVAAAVVIVVLVTVLGLSLPDADPARLTGD
ncbi:MAG TPA: amino acid permease, partial [Pseudolysinimonas sp.]